MWNGECMCPYLCRMNRVEMVGLKEGYSSITLCTLWNFNILLHFFVHISYVHTRICEHLCTHMYGKKWKCAFSNCHNMVPTHSGNL